jgi:hypothetical protein
MATTLQAGTLVGDTPTLVSFSEQHDNPKVTVSPGRSSDRVFVNGSWFFSAEQEVDMFTQSGRFVETVFVQPVNDGSGSWVTELNPDCAANCAVNFNAPDCIPPGTSFVVNAYTLQNSSCESTQSNLFTMPNCF